SPLDVYADELKDLEVYLTMIGGKIEFAKYGSGFIELPQPPLSNFLIPSLIILPIVALIVFIIVKKNRP
ncbi:MAG: hypothetical protein ACFFCR_15635, partial [Promethearchaeota archaeon]